MKEKIFIANWKMKLSLERTVILVKELVKELKENLENIVNKVDIVICPSFTALNKVNELLRKTKISLGSQNVFWETEYGAFTGEISPMMLVELNCEYVIIGHSERRENLAETDEMVNKKVKAVLKLKNSIIRPIICVGETFYQRQKGQRDIVVQEQVQKALKGVKPYDNQEIIIAYEPVWVIGSGQAVLPEDAEQSHFIIKQTIMDLYPPDIVERNFRIIYGGSVDSSNIASFVSKKTIDGVLVGNASLKAKEFVKMIEKMIT